MICIASTSLCVSCPIFIICLFCGTIISQAGILAQLSADTSSHSDENKEHSGWGECTKKASASCRRSDRASSETITYCSREMYQNWVHSEAHNEGLQQSDRPSPGSRFPGKRYYSFHCKVFRWMGSYLLKFIVASLLTYSPDPQRRWQLP